MVLARTRVPSLYVTHDQDEAFRIGDRILLLHDGLIVREGAPKELWASPGSSWAAEFLGLGNVISGQVVAGHRITTAFGDFSLPCRHRHRKGDMLHVLARPAQVRNGALLRGTVRDVAFRQSDYRVVLSNELFFDAAQAPRKGTRVSVRLRLECLGPDAAP
jgi:ABC-type Fe3+/spermidine/putrescine transport system ATPase subunit